VPAFTNEQWVIIGLCFLLGIVVGMILMAGGKWKRRYREENARVRELEAENRRPRPLPPDLRGRKRGHRR
jgi:uncharacterized membrane-anchored protein YhcB (DUF1043 family)